MDEQHLLQLKPELDGFLDRFAPLFGKDENQAQARCFVQGLLHKGERRNTENIAAALQGGPVRSLQAFITTGAWRDTAVLSQLRRQALTALAADEAVWNSDETGFPKKGSKSVGVKRQYSGTLGRTDNGQIGVFANYCSAKGHTFMDRRLFLPEEWAHDPARREEAGVPADVIFRTKPALALEMVAQAVAEGIPFRWVGGDSVSGDTPTFVQGVRGLGQWYVLDIACDTQVWATAPRVIPAEDRPRPRRGRPPTTPLVVGERQRVDASAAALPASAWHRLVVGEGSQGPRLYEYAEVPVWFCADELPGPPERLLIRRSLGQSPEWKYQRSNAPATAPLEKVAQVRGTRWTIEEDIASAQGECGLDEYETRGWVGWHHHPALAMLAWLFLVLQKQRLGGKRGADDGARSAGPATPPVGQARVGQRRDPAVVEVAPRTQPSRGGKPSKAAARRTAPAAK